MNITVNQPAQPSPASLQPARLQAVDLPPSNASKTVEKIIAFAICLHEEIDASRFSGPEQFFACAPYVFFKKSNVVFSTPNRPMPMPRSIAVLENDRKRSKKCERLQYICIKKSMHRGFRGPNNFLLARLTFS